jgi:hypothetical protein
MVPSIACPWLVLLLMVGGISSGSCQCQPGYSGPDGGPCSLCAAGTYLGISLANVSCSGGCTCTPSTNTTSGTISDGPGNYVNNLNCQWIIASNAVIQMSFTSFSTEFDYDFVTVNRCTSPSCSSVEQVAELSGSSVSADTTYSSLTGYLQVVFTSDSSVTAPGFVGSWSITRSACLPCTSGKYSGQEGAAGDSVCQTCPSGSNSPVGSSACSCNPGYSGDVGSCSLCTVGTFKTVNGSDPCTVCAAGTYSVSVGATTPCSLCGGGAYSESNGSSTCTNCETGKYATVLGATAPSVCLTCPTHKKDTGCSSSSTSVSDVWCVDPASSDWVSAVLCAPDNHTIVFGPGVYKGGCGATLTRNVRLEAARSGSATLDCEGAGRHFVLGVGATVVIDGLVLANGRSVLASWGDGHGGCIFTQTNSSLVLHNTTFTHCIADKSGGALVLTVNSTASVTGSTIENCSASDGGGVAVHNGSRLELQDSRIESNAAASCGGGLFVDIDSTLRLTSHTVSRNTAGNRGGEDNTHMLLNTSPPEH